MFASLLAVAFIVLKLCGVVAWKWIWVISPLWISLILRLLLAIGGAVGMKHEATINRIKLEQIALVLKYFDERHPSVADLLEQSDAVAPITISAINAISEIRGIIRA